MNNKDTNQNRKFNKPRNSVVNRKDERAYSYYSRVLNEPFDSIEELKEAEEAYYAKLQAKEAKAAQKKSDANRVEDAFKALNAARKTYKEEITTLTQNYSDELAVLKKAFELGKADIHDKLAKAEAAYSDALKAFTEKYPEGYHLTLKDGDFETTISSTSTTSHADKYIDKPFNLFEYLFSL